MYRFIGTTEFWQYDRQRRGRVIEVRQPDSTATTSAGHVSFANLHGDNVTGVEIPSDVSGDEACVGISGWEDATEYGGPALSSGSTTRDPGVVGPLGYGWLGAAQRSTTPETAGLTLMGVRYYDWVTGTFTGPDPVPGGNDTSYGYPNDPINGSDTSGEMFRDDHTGGAHTGWIRYAKPTKKCRLVCHIKGGAKKLGGGASAAWRHRNQVIRYAGYASIGVCIVASAGACAAVAAGVAAVSIANRADQWRTGKSSFKRFAFGSAGDVFFARTPGFRSASRYLHARPGRQWNVRHAVRYGRSWSLYRRSFRMGAGGGWTKWS